MDFPWVVMLQPEGVLEALDRQARGDVETTSAMADAAEFAGCWEDDDGTAILIKDGRMYGAYGTFDIVCCPSRKSLEIEVGDGRFQAMLTKDGRLQWSDGSSWSRTSNEATTPERSNQVELLPRQAGSPGEEAVEWASKESEEVQLARARADWPWTEERRVERMDVMAGQRRPDPQESEEMCERGYKRFGQVLGSHEEPEWTEWDVPSPCLRLYLLRLRRRAREAEGIWLCDEGRFSFEIRLLEDGGFQHSQDVEAAALKVIEGSAAAGVVTSSWTGLWYAQRRANGSLLAGALSRGADSQWTCDGALNDQTRVTLRHDGLHMLLRYRKPDTTGSKSFVARRPEAYAFYNAYDHPQGSRYVHLACDSAEVSDFPLVGLTSGWLPASLIDESDEEVLPADAERVGVRLIGTFCDPFDVAPPQAAAHLAAELLHQAPGPAPACRPAGGLHGPAPAQGKPTAREPAKELAARLGCSTRQLWEQGLFRGGLRELPRGRCRQGLELRVPAALVRPAESGAPPRPLLSLVLVRWYDYWSDPRPCSDYSVLNDGFFADLLVGPCSVGQLLPGEYEVLTVFVRGTRDLAKLRPGHLRAMLKGRNTSAWYFLWPSAEGDPGCVSEREFFRLCRAMERARLRQGWPHEPALYRTLCGKLWIPQMSLNAEYRVPPTTHIHYAEFRRHSRKAASRALDSLARIRRSVWGKDAVPAESFRGVVKLGFSWCGADVLPFRGLHSLVANLQKLFSHPRCESLQCLVQEMVPDVVGEYRILIMHDKARSGFRRETMWMQNCAPSESLSKHKVRAADVAEFSMASHWVVEPVEVAGRFFRGDAMAQRAAEEQADRTVDAWLRWYSTQSPVPPQCTRIDFLVGHTGPGRAVAWTCEVGECGGSLCTVEVHGRNTAVLNRAILQDRSGRFPVAMPATLPRNRGEKG